MKPWCHIYPQIYPLPHISLSVNRIIFMHYILRGAGAIISTCSLLTRAMCMQDWLEQIAFVCFVSLDEEDDERTCPERAEHRGWGGWGPWRMWKGERESGFFCDDRDEFDKEKDSEEDLEVWSDVTLQCRIHVRNITISRHVQRSEKWLLVHGWVKFVPALP